MKWFKWKIKLKEFEDTDETREWLYNLLISYIEQLFHSERFKDIFDAGFEHIKRLWNKFDLDNELKQRRFINFLIGGIILILISSVSFLLFTASLIGIGLVVKLIQKIISLIIWGFRLIRNQGLSFKKVIENLLNKNKKNNVQEINNEKSIDELKNELISMINNILLNSNESSLTSEELEILRSLIERLGISSNEEVIENIEQIEINSESDDMIKIDDEWAYKVSKYADNNEKVYIKVFPGTYIDS